jgi:hypothetical protein
MENETPEKIKIALVAPPLKRVGGQSIQAQRLAEAIADETVAVEFI